MNDVFGSITILSPFFFLLRTEDQNRFRQFDNQILAVNKFKLHLSKLLIQQKTKLPLITLQISKYITKRIILKKFDSVTIC